MPREISPAAKTPKTNGKPLGLPTWALVGAGIAGLIIGYMIIRKSGGSVADASTGNSGNVGSIPSGTDSGNSGGGVVASPPPDIMAILKALGIVGGGSGGTNSSLPTNTASNVSSSSSSSDAAALTDPNASTFTATPIADQSLFTPTSTPVGTIDPQGFAAGAVTFNPMVPDSPSYALSGGEQASPIGTVGITGTIIPDTNFSPGGREILTAAPHANVLVDPSGHVVNAKGARVGGVTDNQ